MINVRIMKRMIIGSLLFICGATTIYAQEATNDDEYRQTFDRVALRLEKPDYSNFVANLAEKYGIDDTDENATASEQLASTLRNTAEVTDRLTAALEKKTLEQPYNDFYLLAKDQISLEDLKKVEHLLYSDLYIRSSKQSLNFQLALNLATNLILTKYIYFDRESQAVELPARSLDDLGDEIEKLAVKEVKKNSCLLSKTHTV